MAARSRLATKKFKMATTHGMPRDALSKKNLWQLRSTLRQNDATACLQKIGCCRNNIKKHLSTWQLRATYLLVFLFQGELLLFDNLELVAEVELGGLLLQLGEFVLVLGDLLQRRLDAARKSKKEAVMHCKRCTLAKYLQFTAKVVDLGVEVGNLSVSRGGFGRGREKGKRLVCFWLCER